MRAYCAEKPLRRQGQIPAKPGLTGRLTFFRPVLGSSRTSGEAVADVWGVWVRFARANEVRYGAAIAAALCAAALLVADAGSADQTSGPAGPARLALAGPAHHVHAAEARPDHRPGDGRRPGDGVGIP